MQCQLCASLWVTDIMSSQWKTELDYVKLPIHDGGLNFGNRMNFPIQDAVESRPLPHLCGIQKAVLGKVDALQRIPFLIF